MGNAIEIERIALRNGWEVVADYVGNKNTVEWTLRSPNDHRIRSPLTALEVQVLMQMRTWQPPAS